MIPAPPSMSDASRRRQHFKCSSGPSLFGGRMNNPGLVQLNFRALVDYGGQPRVMNLYDPANRPHCQGYCVNCEDKGLVYDGELDLMSHGCDTSDFETLLGKLSVSHPITVPVMFLLEDPGGDYGNGEVVMFQGHSKRPPNNHYFWTPENRTWPRGVGEFGANFYGPYFAYLMATHGLGNVYITNAVKCGTKGSLRAEGKKSQRYKQLAANCRERFLAQELRLFKPQLVFCFGESAHDHYRGLASIQGFPPGHLLKHPAFIHRRWQTVKPPTTQQELINQNDEVVQAALARLPGD
uniref:Uracil-DNA glycosylase-like domain-containing protein n=1 Tax=uncultured bacterium 5G4 TaxID=1701326 RepID=A0A166H2W4_9BACT|nr:hypothetical protein 5G4_014 [uncultured bacterium 5G4]